MSVDNNAILFVGLQVEKVLNKKQLKRIEDDEDDLEFLTKDEAIMIKNTNGYDSESKRLIGYEIADSGSYGLEELGNDLPQKIELRKQSFEKEFNKKAKIYLFNYQW